MINAKLAASNVRGSVRHAVGLTSCGGAGASPGAANFRSSRKKPSRVTETIKIAERARSHVAEASIARTPYFWVTVTLPETNIAMSLHDCSLGVLPGDDPNRYIANPRPVGSPDPARLVKSSISATASSLVKSPKNPVRSPTHTLDDFRETQNLYPYRAEHSIRQVDTLVTFAKTSRMAHFFIHDTEALSNTQVYESDAIPAQESLAKTPAQTITPHTESP